MCCIYKICSRALSQLFEKLWVVHMVKSELSHWHTQMTTTTAIILLVFIPVFPHESFDTAIMATYRQMFFSSSSFLFENNLSRNTIQSNAVRDIWGTTTKIPSLSLHFTIAVRSSIKEVVDVDRWIFILTWRGGHCDQKGNSSGCLHVIALMEVIWHSRNPKTRDIRSFNFW